MPTTNKERERRIAQRRVEGFAQQFGEAHRNLARHAAVFSIEKCSFQT